MSTPGLYVTSEEPEGIPFTLDHLITANVDAPIAPHDLTRLAVLAVGEHLDVEHFTGSTTITRVG